MRPASTPRRLMIAIVALALASACGRSRDVVTTAVAIAANEGGDQVAAVGAPVSIAPSVKVTDSAGNPVGGAAVTFAVEIGGGTITGGNQITDALGVATVGGWTLGATSGTNTLTATGPGLAGSPVTFTASAQFQVRTISAGSAHSCALTAQGLAYCWGKNTTGELGDGTHIDSLGPVSVAGEEHFLNVSAGFAHTCAVAVGGAAYCWGGNSTGELGDNSTVSSATPVAVAGGLVFQSVASGGFFSCGLTSAGAAYCWGDNSSGQLGAAGTNAGSRIATAPVAVAGGLTFRSISVGSEFACALTGEGAAYCWGDNGVGQLGTGSLGGTVREPTAVAGELSFETIAAGFDHTCGVTTSGDAYCWGDNTDGEVGDGTTANHATPAAVAGGFSFQSVLPGESHTCGLTGGGDAYCWGDNGAGELGDSSAAEGARSGGALRSATPVPVAGDRTFRSVAAGGHYTCGVTTGGGTFCWGWNGEGELGDATTRSSGVAVPIRPP